MRRLILKIGRKYDKYLNRFRIWKLRLLGANVGRGVRCNGKFFAGDDLRNLTIGDGAGIGAYNVLNCRDRLIIGKGVQLSGFVLIQTGSVDLSQPPPWDRVRHVSKPVVIEDYAVLMSSVIVSPGVTIGKYSCVGAGSVVTHDVKPGWFYAGVPARPIKPIGTVASEVKGAAAPDKGSSPQS